MRAVKKHCNELTNETTVLLSTENYDFIIIMKHVMSCCGLRGTVVRGVADRLRGRGFKTDRMS